MAKDMSGGANSGQNINGNIQEDDKMITGGSDVFHGWLTLMETGTEITLKIKLEVHHDSSKCCIFLMNSFYRFSALMLVCARWLRA